MSTQLIINATILNQSHLTGLGVYTANLLPPLVRSIIDDDRFAQVVIAGNPERLQHTLGTVTNHPKIQVRRLTTEHPIGRLIALDRLVVSERQQSGETIFYSPTHHGVVRRGLTQVITVHDLFARIFPHNYRQQYYYFRWYLPRVLARTSRVIVDSASTTKDLQRYYPNSPPAVVVHAAIRSDLSTAAPQAIPSLSNQSYFLFIGPSYRYKNCVRLIDAFAAYRRSESGKLVLVGGRETYVGELKHHLSTKYTGLREDVIFLDYVEVSELAWLYKNATALMLTTLYEGFGLPALEAMACGCPVIASWAGSLPEVCGEAAQFEVTPGSLR
jgi:glycosyltransferase involved in cell wall biosynthesis